MFTALIIGLELADFDRYFILEISMGLLAIVLIIFMYFSRMRELFLDTCLTIRLRDESEGEKL